MRRVAATKRKEQYFHFGVKTPVKNAPTYTLKSLEMLFYVYHLSHPIAIPDQGSSGSLRPRRPGSFTPRSRPHSRRGRPSFRRWSSTLVSKHLG